MSYQHYSVEDLLADESFQRYCSGTDDAAVRFWKAVLQEQPEMELKFKEAIEWYKLLNGNQGDLQQQTSRLLKRVEENSPDVQGGPARVKPLYRTWWAAAAVLVFVVCGLWFMVRRDKAGPSSVALAPRVEQDIAPGGDKAILTLADGTRVVLDTAGNGAITKQGNVTVIKLNGQLAYSPSTSSSSSTSALTYNTITTPRGGQYQLVLADGSKVWLNAASSLRFPTAFVGKERRVELTGEGYFEVTASPDPSGGGGKRPFIVQRGETEVKVLGLIAKAIARLDGHTVYHVQRFIAGNCRRAAANPDGSDGSRRAGRLYHLHTRRLTGQRSIEQRIGCFVQFLPANRRYGSC